MQRSTFVPQAVKFRILLKRQWQNSVCAAPCLQTYASEHAAQPESIDSEQERQTLVFLFWPPKTSLKAGCAVCLFGHGTRLPCTPSAPRRRKVRAQVSVASATAASPTPSASPSLNVHTHTHAARMERPFNVSSQESNPKRFSRAF